MSDPSDPQPKKTPSSSCFRIELDPNRRLGRHLIATRDIDEGEVILQESPLVVGPRGIAAAGSEEKTKAFSTCLGCYKNVISGYKCSKCGWPVCSPVCERIPDHSRFECIIFASSPVSPVTHPGEYERIKVLRALLLSRSHPPKWALLLSLESHWRERGQDVAALSQTIALYKFIREECHLHGFGVQELSHVAGVSAINSYSSAGIRGHHSDERLKYASFIFANASLLSHSCAPNAKAMIHEEDSTFMISVLALRPILSGEVITTSYLDPSIPLTPRERRAFLMSHFYFSCSCPLCKEEEDDDEDLSS